MNKEKLYQPSPAELEKSRTISDAGLLHNGAEYILDEKQKKHLFLGDEQLEIILKDKNLDGYCKHLSDHELFEFYVSTAGKGWKDWYETLIIKVLDKNKFDEDIKIIKAEISNRNIDEDTKSKILEEADIEVKKTRIIEAFLENPECIYLDLYAHPSNVKKALSDDLKEVLPNALKDKDFLLELIKSGEKAKKSVGVSPSNEIHGAIANNINKFNKEEILGVMSLPHLGRKYIYSKLSDEYQKDKDIILSTFGEDENSALVVALAEKSNSVMFLDNLWKLTGILRQRKGNSKALEQLLWGGNYLHEQISNMIYLKKALPFESISWSIKKIGDGIQLITDVTVKDSPESREKLGLALKKIEEVTESIRLFFEEIDNSNMKETLHHFQELEELARDKGSMFMRKETTPEADRFAEEK